jgi:hypothetical protein
MWVYTLGTFVLWVVNPELRRVFEWRFGYGGVDVFPLFPFLAVLPHVFSLTYGGGWQRLPRPLMFSTWVWLGAFCYAFVLAIVNGNATPGAYSLCNFVLPLGLGLWIAADPASAPDAVSRVTRVAFLLTSVISVYGIVQYVVAPEWDRLWLEHVIAGGALSFGRPEPFQIRVFSMLASPGPFGGFLAVMLLFALPHLSVRRLWLLAQMPIWLVAFGLSQDRSGWLLFGLGACVYLLLSPRRGAMLFAGGICAALMTGLVVLLPAMVGNDGVFQTLSDRFSTLSDPDSDRSANDRLNLYGATVSQIVDAPFGYGLGVVGTATKLSDSSATTDVDSGFLCRLLEMGVPGFAMFVGALGVLMATLLKMRYGAGRVADVALQMQSSMAISVLVALFGSELSGDVSGLLMLALWLVCGVTLRAYLPMQRAVTDERAFSRCAWSQVSVS